MTAWTDDRVAIAKKMFAEGSTYTQIGEAVGMTRGAVGGKLNRLGLTTAHGSTWGQGKSKTIRSRSHAEQLSELHFAKRQKVKRQHNSAAGKAKREAKAAELRSQFEAVEIVDLPPDQSAVAVSFFNLTPDKCKWPVSGDARNIDAMLFCGDKRHDGRPYCARHCRMAYVKPQRLTQTPSYEFRRRA